MPSSSPRIPGRIFWIVPLVALVIGASIVSVHLWGGRPERLAMPEQFVVRADMTPRQIAAQNHLPERVVRKALRVRGSRGWDRTIGAQGIGVAAARTRLRKTAAIAAEAGAKNWRKIVLKFVLWALALGGAWWLVRRGRMRPRVRWIFYLAAVLLFGVALGGDPSPMGTVKDAVVLWGRERVIFGPRMIALGVFLLFVVLFNKAICGWGCQVGTLQDLIFRLNRNGRDRRGLLRQWKPPFWLSNGVRVLFFAAMVVGAVGWGADVVEPLDPFRIFKPAHLGWIGAGFLALLLPASLFVYRPWCHFFCPFGLVGWVVEKVSLYRVRVNHDTCIACEACHRACPSRVMESILKQDRAVVPDCFACGTCIEACPTGSVTLTVGRRGRLPEPWHVFRQHAKDRRREAVRAPEERP